MKFVKDFFKKNKTATPAPVELPKEKSVVDKIKSKLKSLLPHRKEKPAEAENSPKKKFIDFEKMKESARKIVTADTGNGVANAAIKVTGGVLAAGAVVADVALLGGVCTITVLSCLYSEIRNKQEMKKLGKELEEIDDKLDDIGDIGQPSKLSGLASTVVPFSDAAKKQSAQIPCSPATFDIPVPKRAYKP